MTLPHSIASRRWLRDALVIALVLILFGQLVLGARHLSMTSDEPPHLINGYVVLTTGSLWVVPAHGHPPLVNAWSAWPLLFQPERPDLRSLPDWQGDLIKFVRAAWPLFGPIERLAFVTRYPIMLLAVVLMALVYRWACDWFGPWGGILAVAVMTWDPTLIAHAQLDTTDLGVTLFGFAAVYLLNRFIRRFSWQALIGIGLMLGCALASKPSGLLLAPIILALLGWGYMQTLNTRRAQSPLFRTARQWAGCAILIVLIGGVVLWATFGFELGAWPGLAFPIPLASYVRMLNIFFAQKHGVSFLNGQLSTSGWWWYFPFAFAIKSPIPLMILIAAALIVLARRPQAILTRIVLWFFPVVYWATALQSDINLGFRHLLPTFPFVYVGLARLAPWLASLGKARGPLGTRRIAARVIALAVGVWYIAGTWRVYPFALAYFNELVGGPRNGYHYLVDSNVDWGQSFKALKAYMDQAGIASVRLSYYTWIDPAVYGVRYTPLVPEVQPQVGAPRRLDPEPGVYAISASTLQGIRLHDPDVFEWFRHRQPTAQPGYGMLVYEVPPRDPPAKWVAQCADPVAPLEAEQIEPGLGRTDLRVAAFDCRQSWLVPSGGQTSGWYSLNRSTALARDSFMNQWLAHARLSYEQRTNREAPAFRLYEQSARTLDKPCSDPPQPLDGPLTFLGYSTRTSAQAGETLEVETCWQVTARPGRLLSIMLHLVGPDGTPRWVADGLGVPIDQWQAADVLVQRHRIEIPHDARAGNYQLLTGAYWLDTQQRWGASSGADVLPLAQVRVESR